MITAEVVIAGFRCRCIDGLSSGFVRANRAIESALDQTLAGTVPRDRRNPIPLRTEGNLASRTGFAAPIVSLSLRSCNFLARDSLFVAGEPRRPPESIKLKRRFIMKRSTIAKTFAIAAVARTRSGNRAHGQRPRSTRDAITPPCRAPSPTQSPDPLSPRPRRWGLTPRSVRKPSTGTEVPPSMECRIPTAQLGSRADWHLYSKRRLHRHFHDPDCARVYRLTTSS